MERKPGVTSPVRRSPAASTPYRIDGRWRLKRKRGACGFRPGGSLVYYVPLPGFWIRGADIDSVGVVWASLGGGHLGSFDRRECAGPLNGPAVTGEHCAQGWEFYEFPGPGFGGLPDNSVGAGYYIRVDRWNTLGLGETVPIAAGNLFDGLHVLAYGRCVTLRVPYPMGFSARGLDGPIDDPSAGWKGRELWSTNGDRVA